MTRRTRLVAGVLLAAALPWAAQAVLVSPLAIFVDAQRRTTEVTLANPTATPEEVTIDVRYGYATTDSLTELPVTPTFAPESVSATSPSAARFLRVFPRRVVLQPGQTQVVRVFASPPPSLPDGEYWARFLATSKQVADTGKSVGEQVGITFAIVTSIPVWFRKGLVKTTIAIDSLSARATRDTLDARVVLSRGGNASWLGTATFELLGADGRAVREWPLMTSVYPAHLRRRFRWALEGLPAGTYTLQLSLRATRADVRASDVLPSPDAREALLLTVP